MLFDALDFIDDPDPRSAAMNMAVDEALLARLRAPTLRVYRWARPAVSFGYFEKWDAVAGALAGREPVRRWTGGGIVPHGGDFTYTLLVPAGDVFLRRKSSESYRAIHERIVGVLASQGFDVSLCERVSETDSRACFEKPVGCDVLLGGRKIAGAAQRRTRAGLLQQGSVQHIALPENFGRNFSGVLSRRVVETALDAALLAAAARIAGEKYETEAWTRKF